MRRTESSTSVSIVPWTIGITEPQKKPITRHMSPNVMTAMTTIRRAKTERGTRENGALVTGAARGVSLAAPDEAVSRPAHGADERRPARVVPELLPQPAHQHVHRAIVGLPVEP